jgi:ATP phosphoribosyltransferase
VIVFIVVPNNKSLASYLEIALKCMGEPSKDKLVVSRGEDVPFIIEKLSQNGRKAVGLTGRDLFKEYGLSKNNSNLAVLKIIRWNDKNAMFGKPVLCVLGPKGKKLEELPRNLRVCINSKYKNLAKRYLNVFEDNGYNFSKIYLSGSTESACYNGLSDLVIDIVYTGTSLKKADLEVYDKIFESDFVIIGVKND